MPTKQSKTILVERSTAAILNPLIDPRDAGETMDRVADMIGFLGRACVAMSLNDESMEPGYVVCEMIEAAVRYERQFM